MGHNRNLPIIFIFHAYVCKISLIQSVTKIMWSLQNSKQLAGMIENSR